MPIDESTPLLALVLALAPLLAPLVPAAAGVDGLLRVAGVMAAP